MNRDGQISRLYLRKCRIFVQEFSPYKTGKDITWSETKYELINI